MPILTSRCERGFVSFDALLSLVPLVLILSLAMQASAMQAAAASERFSRQQLFDKLVSVADYTVKSGAAERDPGLRYPNWLDSSLLTPSYAEALAAQAGVRSLYIGPEEPEAGYEICIYRIVAYGEEKAIGRLFVCGAG